ncbi:DUF3846 domain-containing protein [Mycobacterium sp. M1]|uniref:DUF3846 domain-containing protein n=1 Tax=Mycolicibacter acidiphilus TaxID=2835306 RepID=A0ABS5RM77_9MYCO|nr:DUF3846 domain-containing protein [Mycolicibacter acidiphilus]MBS9535107.1 DUF3846 domain-containing protein [Mycolicibacter acidiphilus]
MTATRIHVLPIYADSVVAPRASNIEPDFRMYQRIVGGYIEAVYGETADGQRVVFYVNEDGRALGLP